MKLIIVTLTISFVIGGSLQRPLDGPVYTGEREWMRNFTHENGTNEHACSRDGKPIGDSKIPNWHVCWCQHKSCDAINGDDKQAAAAWDANCEAKCKRDHCHCELDCRGT